MDKSELRAQLIEKRASMLQEEIDDISSVIFKKIIGLQCYQSAKIIMLYIPFGNEINTLPFMQNCIADGKTAVTPICNHKSRTMDLAITTSFESMQKTKMGLWEIPRESAVCIDSDMLDIILVPGLAFTIDGDRIGYGGGYYDRLFAKAPQAIRLCPSFDSFVIDSLPTEEYDLKIDILITEKRSVFIGDSRKYELRS